MINTCPGCQRKHKTKITCQCGYKLVDGIWENADGILICPTCGGYMEAIYDNVGFTAPDPVHYMLVGFKCHNCQITIDA
jgi:acetone carboxylase gamma subunit